MADYYLGEIRAFASNYAPVDFKLCDGSMLPVSGYPGLFAVIGTTYGGNGVTTFGLPDLRGRLPIGQGQGVGLTARTLGAQGGTEVVAIAEGNLPPHSHNVVVGTVTTTPSTNVATTSSYLGPVTSDQGAGVGYVPVTTTNGASVKPLQVNTVGYTGGNQAHANVMPFTCITYIICVNGLFPQQN